LFQVMYNRFPDLAIKSVNWALVQQEVQKVIIHMSPILEVNPESWLACLYVLIDIIKKHQLTKKPSDAMDVDSLDKQVSD